MRSPFLVIEPHGLFPENDKAPPDVSCLADLCADDIGQADSIPATLSVSYL
jgi:hypothetical protein